MYCGKCGKELNGTEGFCTRCGAPVLNKGSATHRKENNVQSRKHSRSAHAKRGLVGFLILLLAFTVVGLILFTDIEEMQIVQEIQIATKDFLGKSRPEMDSEKQGPDHVGNDNHTSESTVHVHAWSEATCLAPSTCEICGETRGTALEHEWVDATFSSPKTCRRCGATEGSAKTAKLVTDIVNFVSASSTYNGDRANHVASNMLDGKTDTNWTEGVEGNGEGEYVEFSFHKTYLLSIIYINAGNHASKPYYEYNARPKSIKLTFSDGSTQYYTLKDSMSQQDITLEQPVETDSLRITIESVYPGQKWEDTVISDISFVAFE